MSPTLKDKPALLQNVSLLLTALVIGLILAEAVARLLVRIPPTPKVFVHEKSDNPKLLYKPTPGASSFAYWVQNKINQDGFRDRDFTVDKNAGIKRIVFLGDSVIYGYGLQIDQTLPKQLEENFKKNGRAVEVLNLGVSGYESEQEIEFFKEVGLKYQPDLVLVGYTLNDCHYASWELDLFDNLADATVKDPKGKLPQKILSSFYSHSRLFYLLDRKFHIQKKIKELRSNDVPIRRYLEKRNREIKDPSDSPYRQLEQRIQVDAARLGTSKESLDYLMKGVGFQLDDFYSPHWNVSKKAFLELKDLSEKYHFKVAVLIIPIMQEMDHYPLESVHQFLSAEFQSMEFQVIDMMDFGKQIYTHIGRPAISSDGVHFSPRGAKLAGRHLYQELSSLELPA